MREPHSIKQASKRLSLPGNMLLPSLQLTQQTSPTNEQQMSRRMRRASLVSTVELVLNIAENKASCIALINLEF